jgi:hypothetical protein
MPAPVSATKTCATFSRTSSTELYGFVLDGLGVEVRVGYRDAQHVECRRVLRLMGEAHLPGRPHHLPEGSGSRARELLRPRRRPASWTARPSRPDSSLLA